VCKTSDEIDCLLRSWEAHDSFTSSLLKAAEKLRRGEALYSSRTGSSRSYPSVRYDYFLHLGTNIRNSKRWLPKQAARVSSVGKRPRQRSSSLLKAEKFAGVPVNWDISPAGQFRFPIPAGYRRTVGRPTRNPEDELFVSLDGSQSHPAWYFYGRVLNVDKKRRKVMENVKQQEKSVPPCLKDDTSPAGGRRRADIFDSRKLLNGLVSSFYTYVDADAQLPEYCHIEVVQLSDNEESSSHTLEVLSEKLRKADSTALKFG